MLRQLFTTFGPAFKSWREDNAPRLGAALAYYTVFSLPGLLMLLVGVAGLVFGREAVTGRIVRTTSALLGSDGAHLLENVLRTTAAPSRGGLVAIIGAVTLILGGAGVFGALKDALNTVWEVKPKATRGIWGYVRGQLFSVATLLGTAFLLVMSLAVNALVGAIGDRLAPMLPGGSVIVQSVNFLLALAVLSALFALMFKYLADVRVRWRGVWVGAVLTSILFTLGEWLIGVYLGRTNVGSAFGAAGSIVVVLVWLYYSSQIFLFGAEYTRAWATAHGRVEPTPAAEPLTAEDHAQQGIPQHHGGPAPRPQHGRAATAP